MRCLSSPCLPPHSRAGTPLRAVPQPCRCTRVCKPSPCCVHIKAGRSLYTGVNLGCVDGMQGWGTVLSVTTPHPLSPTLLQGVGGWVSEQWLSPPSRSAHTPQNRFPSYASLSPPLPPPPWAEHWQRGVTRGQPMAWAEQPQTPPCGWQGPPHPPVLPAPPRPMSPRLAVWGVTRGSAFLGTATPVTPLPMGGMYGIAAARAAKG